MNKIDKKMAVYMEKNNIKELKLLEWNLNFGSYDDTVPAEFVSEYMRDFDVVILTEIRANKALAELMESLDYDYIFSDDQHAEYFNQVMIAAKKEYKLRKVKGIIKQKNGNPGPDFLHGVIKVGKKEVNIIGTRVKTKEFKDRFGQMKAVKRYMDKLHDPVILSGDVNSGQIRGDADADYASVEELYRYMTRTKRLSELRFYNFHLIKEMMGKKYIMREPVGENGSWGLAEHNGHLFCGHGHRLKNDILVYSDDVMELSDTVYSWQHATDNEQLYKDMIFTNKGKRGNSIDHGYPDHVRLMARLAV